MDPTTRDIPAIPPVADPDRKHAGGASLQRFIETYLLAMFSDAGAHWPWSQTHLDVMAGIERAVRLGDRQAIAMPRGSGKTSLIKAGTLWAALYGYRRWVCVLAATAPKAADIIVDLQTIVETNAALAADFPEVTYAVARLERIINRQRGQTSIGRPTRMRWNADEIVFADVPGSPAAGSIVTASGFDGAGIRGQVRAMPDGTQLRPDLVLIDDPQSDEVARSEFQTAQRIELMAGAVLEMGPPGHPLASLTALTVIREGDVADSMLKDIRWNGIRAPMLVKFPLHCAKTPPDVPHQNWWTQYSTLLLAADTEKATALYAAHQPLPECKGILDKPRPCATCRIATECMDNGAVVSWQHRKYPADLSPIQHAMDRHIRNPALFAAEMQQAPLSNKLSGNKVTPAQMIQRVSGLPIGQVPGVATLLTASIDVHDEVLYFVVCAWEPDFTGQVIWYSTFPEQPARFFRQADPPRPLSAVFPGQSKDGVIQAGLERLVGVLLKHEFLKHAGGTTSTMQIENLLIDSGYKPTLVYNVRRKLGSPIIHASRGLPLRATNKPISGYVKKPGWRIGTDWYVPNVQGTREYPHVCIDTNAWKTFLHRALSVAPGTRGALTLYGTPQTMADHEQFAEHVCASEFFTEVFAMGRTVCEYKVMPGRPDNHWLDCLVMAAVGASMRGCRGLSMAPDPPKRRKVSFAQMQQAAQARAEMAL
ncbi:MAG: terminase gpA endonuclease subunit [Tepidisphaerales bacterium]